MRKYILISLLSSSFLLFFNFCTESEMEMKSFTYSKSYHLTSDSIHNGLKVSIEVELPVIFHNKEILTNIQKQIIGKIFSEKPVKTSMVLIISSELTAESGAKTCFKMIYKPPKPNTARPETPIPMTAPPVKETFNALLRLVRAACAVRTLALVAAFIPT